MSLSNQVKQLKERNAELVHELEAVKTGVIKTQEISKLLANRLSAVFQNQFNFKKIYFTRKGFSKGRFTKYDQKFRIPFFMINRLEYAFKISQSTDDSGAVHKLFGVSFGLHPRKNSVRLGWINVPQSDEAKLVIYMEKNKEFEILPLFYVRYGEPFKVRMSVVTGAIQFDITTEYEITNRYEVPFKTNILNYELHPYKDYYEPEFYIEQAFVDAVLFRIGIRGYQWIMAGLMGFSILLGELFNQPALTLIPTIGWLLFVAKKLYEQANSRRVSKLNS